MQFLIELMYQFFFYLTNFHIGNVNYFAVILGGTLYKVLVNFIQSKIRKRSHWND